MNFSELCLKRESTRSYIDKPVDRKIIEEILKDAINSPSACNSQPWKFVVCENGKTLANYITREDLPINKWANQVPVYIVLCETKAKLMSILTCDSQHYAAFDAGSAATTICYSATEKGVSSCIIGCFDEQGIKDFLSIPEDVKVKMLIALGYSESTEPRAKMRKDFDTLVSFNKY